MNVIGCKVFLLHCGWCQAAVEIPGSITGFSLVATDTPGIDAIEPSGTHETPPAPWTKHDGRWDCGAAHAKAPDGVILTHRHNGVDGRGKICRCFQCGTEAVPTPVHDYFTLAKDGDGAPLYCERCFMQIVGAA